MKQQTLERKLEKLDKKMDIYLHNHAMEWNNNYQDRYDKYMLKYEMIYRKMKMEKNA